MPDKELLIDFEQLNEGELYYKSIFEACKSTLDNNKYIDKNLFEKIVKTNSEYSKNPPKGVFILPEQLDDSHYFQSDNEKNVMVLRHNRYTPLFYNKHTFYEIICVLKGSCEHIVLEKNSVLNAGSICFLPPGMTHAIAVFDDESIVINILIRRKFFTNMLYNLLTEDNVITEFFIASNHLKESGQYLTFHFGEKGDVLRLICEMYTEANFEEIYNKQIIECQIIIFFSKLLRYYSDTMEKNIKLNVKNNQAYEFILYIEQHIDDITLSGMAKSLGYTTSHLSKKFKNVSGLSFHNVVKNLKIQKAKQYLSNSNYKIADISKMLGYKNEESFMKMFKSSCGITAAEYRKKSIH